MSQAWYYDFMNPNQALSRALLKEGLPFEIHYIKDIASTKISMFKYDGIEKIKDLTSEILETSLMFTWNLCFYKYDAIGGWVLCKFSPSSMLNLYMKPTTVNLTFLNGESIANDVPYKDIIIVRDNSINLIPFIPIVEYIRKMQKIDNSVFKILNVAALPLAFVGNKKTANSLKTIAKEIVGDNPVVVGDDSMVDSLKAFDMDVKVNPLDIYELKTKYKNECLSSIGIYTVEEKKERKIVSEVASQNDFTDFVYQDMKSQREEFIDKLNKADPTLNIKLVESYRQNFDETVEETKRIADAQGTGGANNGEN